MAAFESQGFGCARHVPLILFEFSQNKFSFVGVARFGAVRATVLQTGAVTPVDARLEIGSASESVQVTAETTLLETETSSTGTVTEGDVLYKLPLFQRNITNSMVVMPGLNVQTTGGSGGIGAYTVGGQRNSGTALFEDGVWQRSSSEHLGGDPADREFGGGSQGADGDSCPPSTATRRGRADGGQEERHEPASRDGLRLRANADHGAPAVF